MDNYESEVEYLYQDRAKIMTVSRSDGLSVRVESVLYGHTPKHRSDREMLADAIRFLEEQAAHG